MIHPSFNKLHELKEFKRLYETAVASAAINYKDKSQRILDIQGGDGILGRLILSKGEISYTNLDDDESILEKSPGINIKSRTDQASRVLEGEFDRIFLLNQEVNVPRLAEDAQYFKGVHTTLNLSIVDAYLRKAGKFVMGGILNEDNIESLEDYFTKKKTGIKLVDSKIINLSEPTKDAFVSYELSRLGKYSENIPQDELRMARDFYKDLKIIVFERKQEGNPKTAITGLKDIEKIIDKIWEEIMWRDRFGD